MDVILYSTGCPKCNILISKLRKNKISYETVTDKDEMIKIGITEVPILKVNGKLLRFSEANDWINNNW